VRLFVRSCWFVVLVLVSSRSCWFVVLVLVRSVRLVRRARAGSSCSCGFGALPGRSSRVAGPGHL